VCKSVFPKGIQKPAVLTKSASDWWDKTVPALESRGQISVVDEQGLRQMCECVNTMAKAAAHLRTEGYITEYPNGQSGINHWHTLWQKSAELYNRLAVQFGMTPAARIKLKLEDKAADDAMRALLMGEDDEAV
jgi:P27 family predicted phage terminase small subunit